MSKDLPSDFEGSGALVSRAYGFGGAVEGDGLETGGIVGTDWSSHDQQFGFVGRVHTQSIVSGEVKRTNIETEL